MGIIAGALFAGGYLNLVDGKLPIPFWVDHGRARRDCARHAVGRLAHHPHDGLAHHQAAPVGGFAAETAGAISLFTATHLGVPVSTTHTITGAIIGVGSIRRLSAVRWGVAGRIVWAWVLTIPAVGVHRRASSTGSSRTRSRRS